MIACRSCGTDAPGADVRAREVRYVFRRGAIFALVEHSCRTWSRLMDMAAVRLSTKRLPALAEVSA